MTAAKACRPIVTILVELGAFFRVKSPATQIKLMNSRVPHRLIMSIIEEEECPFQER